VKGYDRDGRKRDRRFGVFVRLDQFGIVGIRKYDVIKFRISVYVTFDRS